MSKKITHAEMNTYAATLNQRAGVLKDNHKIGSRNAANIEVQEVATVIENIKNRLVLYVIQASELEKAVKDLFEVMTEANRPMTREEYADHQRHHRLNERYNEVLDRMVKITGFELKSIGDWAQEGKRVSITTKDMIK